MLEGLVEGGGEEVCSERDVVVVLVVHAERDHLVDLVVLETLDIIHMFSDHRDIMMINDQLDGDSDRLVRPQNPEHL